MHPAAQIPMWSLGQEVEMIAHQDEGQGRDLIARAGRLQQFQELKPGPLVAKYLLPLIPTRAEVINRIRKFNSQWPRHGVIFYQH